MNSHDAFIFIKLNVPAVSKCVWLYKCSLRKKRQKTIGWILVVIDEKYYQQNEKICGWKWWKK